MLEELQYYNDLLESYDREWKKPRRKRFARMDSRELHAMRSIAKNMVTYISIALLHCETNNIEMYDVISIDITA